MEEALRDLILSALTPTNALDPEALAWGRRIGLPAVALHLITGPTPDMTMAGPSGLEESTVQVDCWAATYAAAAQLARLIRKRLAGYASAGVLHLVIVEGGGSDFETAEGPVDAGQPANFHRIRLDLRVWHINP